MSDLLFDFKTSHLISVNGLSFPFGENQRVVVNELANSKPQKLDALFNAIHHHCKASRKESQR